MEPTHDDWDKARAARDAAGRACTSLLLAGHSGAALLAAQDYADADKRMAELEIQLDAKEPQ